MKSEIKTRINFMFLSSINQLESKKERKSESKFKTLISFPKISPPKSSSKKTKIFLFKICSKIFFYTNKILPAPRDPYLIYKPLIFLKLLPKIPKSNSFVNDFRDKGKAWINFYPSTYPIHPTNSFRVQK